MSENLRRTITALDTASAYIADLQRITADLNGYIEQRATDLAAPLIEKAQAEAAEQVRRIEMDLQRQTDLVAECRRQMKPLIRHSERYALVHKVIRAWASRSRGPLDGQAGELLREVSDALNARIEAP